MQNSLLPRLLLAAVAVSASILGLAWFFGDPGPRESPTVAASLDADDLPGRFDSEPDVNRENPLQRVERTTFLTEQDGKLTALSWEVLTPRTDFVSDVRLPRARVELGPDRLLVLEAAEGTVEHPGNDFQRGDFRGGTVATFHRLPTPGAPISDATAVLRLLLDAPTTFDRELGRLSTAGPMRMTGPNVDLTGVGLELDFSRAEGEVKSLVLEQTRLLRIRQDAGRERSAPGAGPAPPTGASAAAQGQAQASGSAPGSTPTPSPASPGSGVAESEADASPTIYRVEASGDVRVRADSGARLSGETLLVFFNAAEESRPEASSADAGPGPNPATGPAPRAADRGPEDPETATVRGAGESETEAEATATQADPDSLFVPGEGTVELTWAGPLRLRPAAPGEGPEVVQSPAFQGAHLLLEGSATVPATAESGASALAAHRLAYATADGRLIATGLPGQPVVADDPTAGRLIARRVEAEPRAGSAFAIGPGELRAMDPAGQAAAAGTDATQEALQLSFQEAMSLRFEPPGSGSGPASASASASGDFLLKEAVFTGSVRVLAHLDEGAQADADQSDADGAAAASPSASNPLARRGGPLTLEASRMTLGFAAPAPTEAQGTAGAKPRPSPESLFADGGVFASRAASADPDLAGEPPAWTLRSEDLRVALAPALEHPSRPEVVGLEATGAVTVEASADPGTDPAADPAAGPRFADALFLTADRLVASPRLDRVQLDGGPDRPATARRGGLELRGGTLIAGLESERLEVRGPGQLDRFEVPPPTPAAGSQPGDATRLTWTDSLRYDGATGEAEALGTTVTTSASPTERRRIEAGDVRATFEALPENADRAPGGGFASLRRLRADAPTGGSNPQVVVVAETLDTTGKVLSTLRAEGPRLDLEQVPAAGPQAERQLLTMPGPGRLILVDDRPASESVTEEASSGPVRLAGRGATFFRWNDALRLDGRTRDAELTGSVFMNHDPRDGSARVKLYGDRLLASFAAGEENATLGAESTAELQSVRIDGSVVVEQEERTITADHLRFRTGSEEVQLWSDDGRGMNITAGGRTLRADSATWNLRTDRVDVRGVGGASEPLR